MNKSENQSDEPKKDSNCKYVYRIIPIDRALDLFANSENTLVEPYKWDDPLEGWIYNELLSYYKEKNVSLPCGKFFGQSWTMETMSDPMWKIYSNGTDSVRIKSTVDELKNNKRPDGDTRWYVGKIKYKHFPKLSLSKFFNMDDEYLNHNIDLLASSYFIKRWAFRHEKEIRLICYTESESIKLFKYCICPKYFIKEIMMHPGISDSKFRKFEKTFRAYGFEGCIRKSEIYKLPERMPYRHMVVKKSNDREENFNQQELARSVKIAMHPRQSEQENLIHDTVREIVCKLKPNEKNKISSSKIEEDVFKALSQIDEAASLRYASVYKFKSAEDFNNPV